MGFYELVFFTQIKMLKKTFLFNSNNNGKKYIFIVIANDKSVTELVSRYIKEIEKLKAKLIEAEQMYHQLKKSMNTTRKNIITFPDTEGWFRK